jgi:hypothetical protein
MKKTSLTRALFVAGAVALAGAANADAIFYPDGTHVELGNTDVSTLSLDKSMDTSVLGAGASTLPATTTTTTVTTRDYVYVQPNINWDRGTVVSQMHGNPHLVHGTRTQAAATFNVPARAGEASTMTGGAPNALTTNDRVIVGSYVIPYATVTTSPYYVFSH